MEREVGNFEVSVGSLSFLHPEKSTPSLLLPSSCGSVI